MLSKALSHYPQFRFREGEKRLWNPILKKTFVTRPEEQVRLALVDFLTMEAGVSNSRISFESPVKLAGDRSSSRTDIICYNKAMEARLLVECKAPDIKLDEKAAIQVARYNQKVGAPHVLVSNGLLDYWFTLHNQEVRLQQELPAEYKPALEPDKNFSYWKDRAFIGESISEEHQEKLLSWCLQLFNKAHQPVKYIQFEGMDPSYALNHYYRIFGLTDEVRVGISLSANAMGQSRLNVILNESGANTAFLSCSLNELWDKAENNAIARSAKGERVLDVRNIPGLDMESEITGWAEPASRWLLELS